MPMWLLGLITFLLVCVLAAAALGFPYLSMLFGVYGNAAQTLRGRVIMLLLWLFPFVAVASIYMAWSTNSYMIFVPIIYVVFLWLIKCNKDDNAGDSKQFASEADNLQANTADIERLWPTWQAMSSDNFSVLFKIYTSSQAAAAEFSAIAVKSEELYEDIEEQVHDGGTLILYVRVSLNDFSKDSIEKITARMVAASWSVGCEVQSVKLLD